MKFSEWVVKKFGVGDFKKSALKKTDSKIDKKTQILFADLTPMLFQFMKFFGHVGPTTIGGGSVSYFPIKFFQGTSVKCWLSIYQQMNSGTDQAMIQKRDYGRAKNKQVYGKKIIVKVI